VIKMREALPDRTAIVTPRQRMKAFLSGGSVDHIPNGLGACETVGLHNVAYDRLKRVLRVQDPANRVITFMFNAIFEPSVLDAMEGDCILLGSGMCPSRLWGPDARKEWKDFEIWGTTIQIPLDWTIRKDPDGSYWWNDTSKCPPGGLYFDPPAGSGIGIEFADSDPPSSDDFRPSHELPEPLLHRLREQAQWLHENTEYCIVCGEMIHDLQLQPGGTQAWWMRMVEEPNACHAFLDKAVDAALAQLQQLHAAVGEYCEILGVGHDMGDNRGITIGPDLWRDIYKPHYKRLFTEWHRITDMKVNLHTCGSIVDILDDLIECGVDILNPVQISARGMSPEVLMERFGDRVIFLGGALDSVQLPPTTPPDVVYDQVKHNIQVLSRAGKYMFAGVHNLTGDIPEQHLAAMIEAYRDCRDMSS
jgi:uroporphyrinogen decarboxylase